MSRIKQLSQCLEEKFFLTEQEGEGFVVNLFEIIRERLLVDKIVKVKGLGTFKLAEMNARESVDVNTGERITIEGRYKLTFTPENAVRNRINSPFSSFESIDMDEEIDFSAIDEKYESTEPVVDESAVEVVKPLVELAEEEPVVPAENVEPAEPVAFVEPVAQEETTTSSEPIVEETVSEEEPVAQEEPEMENQETPEVEEQETPEVEMPETEPAESESAENMIDETADEEEPTPVIAETTPEVDKNTNAGTTAVRAPICEELIRKDMNHNQTIITLLRWVLALVILVLLCLGGYVLYNVGREKGAMEMEYYLHQHSVESEDARLAEKAAMELVDEDSAEEARPKHDISLIKTPKAEEEKPAAKEEPAAKPTETKVAEKPAPAPAKPAVQPTKPAAQPAKPASNAYDAYNNKDARVRTGAYNIVGVQETVTVREGQTLKSISKFYLGDGMECYVEALNGGKTTFAAGEKVRIPKLELKKKSNK